eukprot:g2160.t1
MCSRGVWQLRELVLQYCVHSGSSRGARKLIREGLVPWCERNPQVQVRAEIRSGRHPCLRAEYLNGNTKVVGVKNLLPLEIEGYMTDLRNQIGKKVSAVKKDVVTDTPSLQGSWTPVLGEALRHEEFSIEQFSPKE